MGDGSWRGLYASCGRRTNGDPHRFRGATALQLRHEACKYIVMVNVLEASDVRHQRCQIDYRTCERDEVRLWIVLLVSIATCQRKGIKPTGFNDS